MTTDISRQAIAFGDFVLQPARQALTGGGRNIPLPGRSFALLMALIARPGELIGKAELIGRLWPDSIVEHSNLRSQVAALRRLLRCGEDGQRYIATTSGQGYRFVAPVQRLTIPSASILDASPLALPDAGAQPLFGRDAEIARISALLFNQRHVTLVGPGGIGKTVLAIAVGRSIARSYPDGVHFIELPSDPDEPAVARALAAGLGETVTADTSLKSLVATLDGKRMLLILNGCEAVRAAAERLAQRLLSHAGLTLLITSRSPLDMPGEAVMRIAPLALPEAGETDVTAILSSPAVQLLSAKMSSCDQPPEASAGMLLPLCTALEGNPLAIELAAGHIDTFGASGLLEMLDDDFLLSMAAREGGVPRHRTLAASVAWSHDLLSPSDQALLRELAIFEGAFTIDSARAVAGAHPFEIVAGMQRLTTKSLLLARQTPQGTRFVLPRPVRAFARARLREGGEFDAVALRLTENLTQHLGGAWCRDYIAGNLPRALDAAHRITATAPLARLVLAALPYWSQQSRLVDALTHIRRAAALGDRDDMPEESGLALQEALATILAARIEPASEQLEAGRALAARAQRLGRPVERVRGHWAMWAAAMNQGRQTAALDHAREALRLAAGENDPDLLAAADRMTGISQHLGGHHGKALVHIDRALAVFAWPERNLTNLPFQFDQRVVALSYRARILLAQGHPDQAMRTAAEALSEAEEIHHPLSIAFTIGIAGLPVAMVLGRHAFGERLVARLSTVAGLLALPAWQSLSDLASGWLGASRGESSGLVRFREAINTLHGAHFGEIHIPALAALAEAQLRHGHPGEAGETLDIALARSESGGDLWCHPELLRLRAMTVIDQLGDAGRQEAIDLLATARQEAIRQKADWWLLRVQISLARLGFGFDDLSRLLAQIDAGRLFPDVIEAIDLLGRHRRAGIVAGSPPPRVMAA